MFAERPHPDPPPQAGEGAGSIRCELQAGSFAAGSRRSLPSSQSKRTPSPACGGGLGWGLLQIAGPQICWIPCWCRRITSVSIGCSNEWPEKIECLKLMAQRSQPSLIQPRSTADKATALKLTPVSRETGRLVFLRSDLALCLLSAPTPTLPRKRRGIAYGFSYA